MKRPDWPGPADTDLPSYTFGERKNFSKREDGADQILDPERLAELKRKNATKNDQLGPG